MVLERDKYFFELCLVEIRCKMVTFANCHIRELQWKRRNYS